jgi:hypothetical protein
MSKRFTLEDVSKLRPSMQKEVAEALNYSSPIDPYAFPSKGALSRALDRKIQAALPERALRDDVEATPPREGQVPVRFRLCVCSYRRVLLDCDNLYGGAKFLVDCCRLFWLVPDDNPQAIDLEVHQEKVKSSDLERTEILIEILP